jgi:hypothetical protein
LLVYLIISEIAKYTVAAGEDVYGPVGEERPHHPGNENDDTARPSHPPIDLLANGLWIIASEAKEATRNHTFHQSDKMGKVEK